MKTWGHFTLQHTKTELIFFQRGERQGNKKFAFLLTEGEQDYRSLHAFMVGPIHVYCDPLF